MAEEAAPAATTAEVTSIEAAPTSPQTSTTACPTHPTLTTTSTLGTAASAEQDNQNVSRDWQNHPAAAPAVPAAEVPVTPANVTATAETTPAATANTAGEATPPLAPSVILRSEHSGSRSYPVARSIVTLVRGAVDHLADHFHEQLHFNEDQSGNTATRRNIPIECLSIRSEGEMPSSSSLPNMMHAIPTAALDSVRSVPATASAYNQHFHHHHHPHFPPSTLQPPTASVMNRENDHNNSEQYYGNMLENDQIADFVLIDGDLVALPPAYYPPNEQERLGLEEYHRDQDFLAQNSCQPKPVRRGVRGLRKRVRKWMRKSDKKDKGNKSTTDSINNNNNNKHSTSSTGLVASSRPVDDSGVFSFTGTSNNSPNISTCETSETNLVATTAAAAAAAAASSTSAAAAAVVAGKKSPKRDKSPHRGWKLKKKKSKASWRYNKELSKHKKDPPPGALNSDQIPQQQAEHGIAAAATESTPFLPAPPAQAAGQQRLQQQQQQQQSLHHQRLQSIYGQQYQQPHQAAYAYDALSAQSPPPPALPPMSGPPTPQESVQASFVCNADMLEAGVLEATTCAEAYIWDDKKDEPAYSVLPANADFKVDKAEAPDVDYMMKIAETSWNDRDDDDTGEELDGLAPPSFAALAPHPQGKSSGMSCPLSSAKASDELVHNDVLKVVMVGAPNADKSLLARAIRQSNKKPKRRATLGVDVHSWTPDMGGQEQIKFSFWDVQGSSRDDAIADFGADPEIQSLFFSSNALYVLVWDLAAENMKTYGRDLLQKQLDRQDDDSDSDDDEDEEEDNEFLYEEAKRQADMALQADIEKRVLLWVNVVARKGPGSSILPVAVIPETMNTVEAKRRCELMQNMLEHHSLRFQGDATAPKLLIGMENIMCVNLENMEGIAELQATLIAIAADEAVFSNVGTPVSRAVVIVQETIRRLKENHKLVLVDHLMGELGRHVLSYNEVIEALFFLADIGELLYFGKDQDELLSRYIILSRKWFVSALSCILRNDLKRELAETRRFMNMQCIYSNHQFPENPVIQSLMGTGESSCPLLSSSDTNMLWLSMQFMREAADQSSQLNENSTSPSTIFAFLERLLVQSGVFLPLQVSHSIDEPEVYFVPCLMETAENKSDLWSFKSNEGWMTTLCHSWLFRDGAPSDLMEHITVGLVRNLHEFSRTFSAVGAGNSKSPPHRTTSFPLVRSGAAEFLRAHETEAVGSIKIHQIMCWQSAFLVKIGCIFADTDTGDLKESFVEIFVTLVDMSSNYCVASDAMRPTMQRLVASGKGQAGHHGTKLWKGGFEVVLKSVQTTLGDFSNIDRQVVCPECLAHSQPRHASTWGWDSIMAAAQSGSSIVRCMRGHRVDSNIICGIAKRQEVSSGNEQIGRSIKPVPELLNSVVLVGLWDADRKEVRNVGSGFIADKRLGLVVTAAHVLFNMEEGRSFGAPYFGIKNAKVVIGVIAEGGHNAVYRYFAEILADDVYAVDACVVRLTSKFVTDIDGDLLQQDETALSHTPLNLEAIQAESLRSLKTTTRFELEESVRILGYNQGGEGVLEQGKHINRSADFAKGYIVKKFIAPVPMWDDDSSHSSEASTKSQGFVPREEIVVIVPTISGHSGGPCVNNDGKVIGILSRADPGERQRCYLVPASEIKVWHCCMERKLLFLASFFGDTYPCTLLTSV